MLDKLDSIMEWAILGVGVDLSECFEDEDEGRRFGYIMFLRWRVKVDKPLMFQNAALA